MKLDAVGVPGRNRSVAKRFKILFLRKRDTMKHIAKLFIAVATLGFAVSGMAAPYSVTYSDTAFTGGFYPPGINAGELATVRFVLDNGNNSTANQTWTAANVQCVIFTFNNVQNAYAAIQYSGNSFYRTVGNFTTDGSGQLQSGTIDWEDGSPITAPHRTNIPGASNLDSWYINNDNDVLFWNNPSGEIGFVNVNSDDQVTNWSNPIPAYGVCDRYFAPTSIPAMSGWGMSIMASLLSLAAITGLRRKQT
jgi:hypothetical protein